MAYTAQQLITRALYLSGVCSRNLQTPTGDQINDGLQMLNDLLNFKQIEVDLLPYYQYIQVTLVPGQEYYYLPNVAGVESATFNLDTVRYPMQATTRKAYYGSARVDNIETLPFNWNFNRALGGGNIALYFVPDQAYVMKLMVNLFFTDVSLNTDLTDVTSTFDNTDDTPYYTEYTFINSSNQGYDTSYIEFLRYSLAQYICSEYGIVFSPQSQAILDAMRRKAMYIGAPDLSINSVCSLNSKTEAGYFNWGDVNLGQGYRPS